MTHRLRTLTVREQAAWMRHYQPTFSTHATNRALRSTGRLQPTSASRVYAVTICYEAGHRPQPYVAELRPRGDALRIPHTYAPDQPCLYYPPGREWRADMTIATTIIPWLSLWLYYYEVWHATGTWMGGGITHDTAEPVIEDENVSHS
jgi:hypothetical protein